MRLKSVALAAVFFASFAHAQQTFDFTNKPSPKGLQEVATLLRTVGDIKGLTVDSAAATVTVTGTPDELATAGWIIHQLDLPTPANSAQYVMPGKSDDVMRVFHLNHISPETPQEIQEILTILRTVGDIQKVFNDTALSDLVVRGTANQLALADYIIKNVDVIPGTVTVAASPEFHYTAPPPNPRGPEVVRVFYLSHSNTPQQLQEILTTLRTVADIQRIFNYTPLSALTIRGTASDLTACEFLIGKLDLPADAKTAPPSEFAIPANVAGGNVIGVYYTSNFSGKKLTAAVTLLRDSLQLTKTFMKTTPQTLIYRGTADQIAKAEQLIKQKDQPIESSSAALPPEH
jgi:type II secretory pathway component GspD/PulD (secretin)